MIELEHKWVGFTAVDARVVAQIGDDAVGTFGVVPGAVASRIREVSRPIAFVMFAIPGFVARSAERVQHTCRAILEGELGKLLALSAATTLLLLPLAHAAV
jgi:hypothetical protein